MFCRDVLCLAVTVVAGLPGGDRRLLASSASAGENGAVCLFVCLFVCTSNRTSTRESNQHNVAFDELNQVSPVLGVLQPDPLHAGRIKSREDFVRDGADCFCDFVNRDVHVVVPTDKGRNVPRRHVGHVGYVHLQLPQEKESG
jgi:hypothetical protein